MKRFLTFILLLSVLILGEYQFFSEFFGEKRLLILLPSLALMLGALYGIIRFVKRIGLQAKQS